MSDERIDLTQFKGKEGMADSIRPLIVVKDTECIAEDNNRIYTDTNYPEGDENRYGWIVATMERSFEYDDDIEGSKKLRDTYAKLFAMAPDLIAELKRCYDFIDSHGLDEDIEHKMVIDLRECSWECLHQLCMQAGVEDGTKEEMIARLLE